MSEKIMSEKKVIKEEKLNAQQKEVMSLTEKLQYIQSNLKVPKSQFNKFGHYNYRNCEDILEALKPLLAETKTFLIISDEIVQIGERYYVKAEVRFSQKDKEFEISTAFARESENRKGMDEAQITGATSSYARKYALNGLFAIDDARDPDNQNNTQDNTQDNTQNIKQLDNTPETKLTNPNISIGPEESKVLNLIIEKLAPQTEPGQIIDIKKLKFVIIDKYGMFPAKLKSADVIIKHITEDLGLDKVTSKNDFIEGLE